MVNAVAAQSLLDFFRARPELQDQTSWIEEDEAEISEVTESVQDYLMKNEGCGTTRCVAGQAVIQFRSDLLSVSEKYGTIQFDLNGERDWDVLGEEILELERRDAHQLFFRTSNEEALVALEMMSQGEVPDWRIIFENSNWQYPPPDSYADEWSDYPDN